jgi:hypothetical protein
MALSADKIRNSRGRATRDRAAITTSATVYIGGLLNFVTTTGRVRAASAAASRKIAGVCVAFEATDLVASGIGNTAGTQFAVFEYGNEWEFTVTTALRTFAVQGLNGFVSDDDKIGGTAVGTAALRVVAGEIADAKDGSTTAWVAIRRFATTNVGI